jgi:hypothetical protein
MVTNKDQNFIYRQRFYYLAFGVKQNVVV